MITPKLTIFPEAQRRLWPELKDTPKHFVLYGGTAIGLRLNHRQSVDFDFFSSQPFSPSELLKQIPYLHNSTVQQSSPNTLTCLVDRDGPIQISFLGNLELNRIYNPDVVEGNSIYLASLLDLAGTKVKVVLDRATYKDYFDIYTLINAGISVQQALAAAQAIFGKTYNPLLSLKALTYFDDGDVQSLPLEIKESLIAAVHNVDFEHLPIFESIPGLVEEKG